MWRSHTTLQNASNALVEQSVNLYCEQSCGFSDYELANRLLAGAATLEEILWLSISILRPKRVRGTTKLPCMRYIIYTLSSLSASASIITAISGFASLYRNTLSSRYQSSSANWCRDLASAQCLIWVLAGHLAVGERHSWSSVPCAR